MRRHIFTVMMMLALAAGTFAAEPATRSSDLTPADMDRLRLEIAELQRRLKAQEAEIERLRKVAGVTTTQPAKTSTTRKTPATRPAAIEQDGPGMYRISAGPRGRFTTTVRAKSREDAISIGMKTVAKTAMEYDENVEIGTLKVEKVGP
jgi:hypothetical protein